MTNEIETRIAIGKIFNHFTDNEKMSQVRKIMHESGQNPDEALKKLRHLKRLKNLKFKKMHKPDGEIIS